MRSRSKLPRSAIALAASLGTMPASARVRLDATSTCSQQRNLFSSLQIRPISGRVYREIKGAPSSCFLLKDLKTFDNTCWLSSRQWGRDRPGGGPDRSFSQSGFVTEGQPEYAAPQPGRRVLLLHAKQLRHLLVLEALPGDVGLNPFAVQHKLRNGALAGIFHHFLGSALDFFDIDFPVGDLMLAQPAFGFMAVTTPGRGINNKFHSLFIITSPKRRLEVPADDNRYRQL